MLSRFARDLCTISLSAYLLARARLRSAEVDEVFTLLAVLSPIALVGMCSKASKKQSSVMCYHRKACPDDEQTVQVILTGTDHAGFHRSHDSGLVTRVDINDFEDHPSNVSHRAREHRVELLSNHHARAILPEALPDCPLAPGWTTFLSRDSSATFSFQMPLRCLTPQVWKPVTSIRKSRTADSPYITVPSAGTKRTS
nr:hypothetical protein CFP56_09208 [Quercus suber]